MLRLCVALLALGCVAAEEVEPQGAWLLASKNPQSQYAVEGMDYVIEYGLFNVGDRPASKITLDDRNSYPSQYFEIVRGVLQISVEKIPAGGNFSHAVVLRPLVSGMFNYTAAIVSYRPDENSKELRNGLTTSPGEAYVYKQKEYERRFASKASYFLIYAIIASPFTLVALYTYVKSQRRYADEPRKYKSN